MMAFNSVNILKRTILDFGDSDVTSISHIAELKEVLREIVDKIWDDGLEPECIDSLIQIFSSANLDGTYRKLMLDCLVPQEKISNESLEKLMRWLIRNCLPLDHQDDCAELLRWLKTMVRFGMVHSETIEAWYNYLIKYLVYPKLIKHLSEILCLAAKPKFMTENNVLLLEAYFIEHHSDAHIKRILWEYAQHVPHIVDKKFHFSKPSLWDKRKLTDFEVVVKAVACKAREMDAPTPTRNHVLCPDLPAVEYHQIRKDADLKKIGEVKSMFELGRVLERLQLPMNELSLVQSEEGIMVLVINGPSQYFLGALKVALMKSPSDTLIAAVSGLQDLLSYGLPPVTPFLSKFLAVWDGNYKEEYVYSLLPRLHFNDYNGLKKRILEPLFRVFVTDSAETKAKILDGLLYLITNLVSVDMKRGNASPCNSIPAPEWLEDAEATVTSLIECVNQMWVLGITLEGPNCTLLILKSLLFYQKINLLVLQCDLPLFFVIPQTLSYSALLSKNNVVVNELCQLILLYRKELVPYFEMKGILGEFEVQVEAVLALADSTFKYLWESVCGERPENFHITRDEFSPSESIGIEHLGIYPLVSTLAKELQKDAKLLSKDDLMALLESFMSGVADFVKFEELDQLR